MIYEEDRTVDEMVDDILGTGDENVREGSTMSSGGGTVAKQAAVTPQEERVACRKCGKMFKRRPGSGRTMCEECFRMSHARARKQPPANSRQMKTETDREGKEAETMQKAETDTQKQWDALDESAPAANETPPERAPEDMTAGELVDALAAGMRREPGDVVLALYEAARDVARTCGIQTRVLIETMYEIDCTLAHVGAV